MHKGIVWPKMKNVFIHTRVVSTYIAFFLLPNTGEDMLENVSAVFYCFFFYEIQALLEFTKHEGSVKLIHVT